MNKKEEKDEGVEELAAYLLSKQQGRLTREKRDPRMLAFRVCETEQGEVKRGEGEKGKNTKKGLSETLPEIAKFLRDDRQCLFRLLIDICGVDYPQRARRFEVVYHLLSTTHNMRLRLIVDADEESFVPSLHAVFPCAPWYERECWDMFGIRFENHPDLRRLLSDYGFQGHPLRKDFPLTGYTEVRYDSEQGRILYEKVSMAQDLRVNDTLMPWHGLAKKHGLANDGLAESNAQTAADDKKSKATKTTA